MNYNKKLMKRIKDKLEKYKPLRKNENINQKITKAGSGS